MQQHGIRRVAVIGTGTIGASWTANFLACGLEVRASDPAPDAEARDVLHSFSVPVFRLKQDVIPGRIITGWFKATKTGTYDIQCAEICGIGHALMPGRVVIETPEQHTAWMASQTGSVAVAALAPRGQE